MDAWQFVVVTGLFVAAGKWYTSCQMHYWASSECSGDWNPPRRRSDDPDQRIQKAQEHGYAGCHLRRRGARLLLDRSAVRKIGRPPLGGRR